MKCAYAIAIGSKARMNELSSEESSRLTGYVVLGMVQLQVFGVHAQFSCCDTARHVDSGSFFQVRLLQSV